VIQVIIQARMNSTRLPGKVALPFVAGYTFLGWTIERIRLSKMVERVVVATSTDPKDDAIEELCARHAVAVVRGSEDDVVARFAEAIRQFPANVIVRATADNPLIDLAGMDRTIGLLEAENLEYVTAHSAGFALGTGTEAFTAEAFARVAAAVLDAYEREHVTPYFYRQPALFRQRKMTPREGHRFSSRARLTLDTAEDLRFLKALAEAMGFSRPATQPANGEILSFLESRPDIAAINAHVVQSTLAAP
jgi:spore coat polysaccharide biosynthesis protein SpsF